MSKTQEFLGTGRRKTSVARVRLSEGNGKVLVNGRSLDDYFVTDAMRSDAMKPLDILEAKDKYDVRVNVEGGGLCGQAGAVKHGIARALLQHNPDFRSQLKPEGVLTRDSRMKERKKYGQPGARKRFQFSKR